MSVLIVYASVEGQTRKIAEFVRKVVTARGHDARLFDADDALHDVSLDGVDAVILASSVHERRHGQAFEVFASSHGDALNAHRCMMISVSLSAAFEDSREEARDYLEEMKLRTGLKPDVDLLVGGAIRTAEYDYYASQIVRHVVLRDKPFDPNVAEHEFTDWASLEAGVEAFLTP